MFLNRTPPITFDKQRVVTQYAKDAHFIDVGGLWGVKGEMLSPAFDGGAASLTMADRIKQNNPVWAQLDDRLRAHGVQRYEAVNFDIMDERSFSDYVGQFDFVHCSGIMYHVSDVFLFLRNLMKLSRRYVLVAGVVFPQHVIGHDGALCGASLNAAQERRVRAWLERNGISANGFTAPGERVTAENEIRNGPWWWLYTSGFMSRCVRQFNVEVIEEGYSNKKSYSILVEKRQ